MIIVSFLLHRLGLSPVKWQCRANNQGRILHGQSRFRDYGRAAHLGLESCLSSLCSGLQAEPSSSSFFSSFLFREQEVIQSYWDSPIFKPSILQAL